MTELTTKSATDLERRIRGLFLNALNIEVDSVDTDLIETGLLDSLLLVELLLRLEEEFKIDIVVAELDIESFRTLRSIGKLITGLRTDQSVT
jgi:D-alanine--poly(phosphoribitol) ligase subunit 2